ncbi:MAG: RNA polymerase sigma factor [Acidimicrobiia bacterium]
MRQTSLSHALNRFKPIGADVWEYRADLGAVARHLCQDASTSGASPGLIPSLSGTVNGERVVMTWLHRLTAGEARRLLRKSPAAAVARYLEAVVAGRVEGVAPESADLVLEVRARRAVLGAFSALHPKYQEALLLREGPDMSVAAIARLAGVTPAAVRSVLYRARKALRARLDV